MGFIILNRSKRNLFSLVEFQQLRVQYRHVFGLQGFLLRVEQVVFLGMKNTVELLTEKNNLLNAQQETLQAKYMAILNTQLLKFYQGEQIGRAHV